MAVFTGTLSPTEALTTFEKLEHAARRAIMEAGGSLSHHHGVGKHRAPLVGQIQSPAMLHAMRQLKSVVDPSEILGAKNGAWSDAVATHVLANLDDGASLHDARSEGFIDDSELREAQRWADADDPESGDSSLGTEGTDAERARTRSLGSREQGGIAAEIVAENRAEAEKPRDEGVGVGINSQLSSLRPGSQLTLGITEAPAPGDTKERDEFVAAAEAILASDVLLPQSEQLELYALYKQATVGDAPPAAQSPPRWSIRERKKWVSWNELRGLGGDVARERYVALATS